MDKKKNMQGFTLIEIMIVVVIVGILASIAYPSYTEYVNRSNRAEGQATLMDLAARQERYFAQNNSYTDKLADLGVSKTTSETGKYTISIVSASNKAFELQATPTFNDSKCGNLKLDNLGLKKSGAGEGRPECWR